MKRGIAGVRCEALSHTHCNADGEPQLVYKSCGHHYGDCSTRTVLETTVATDETRTITQLAVAMGSNARGWQWVEMEYFMQDMANGWAKWLTMDGGHGALIQRVREIPEIAAINEMPDVSDRINALFTYLLPPGQQLRSLYDYVAPSYPQYVQQHATKVLLYLGEMDNHRHAAPRESKPFQSEPETTARQRL